jgi:DNA repair exonuclease SbcCD ATPase subunit
MKTRLLPLIAVFLLFLLSGCSEKTEALKAKIADQQREIAQLKEANESLEKESARARAWQGNVNLVFVYEFAGPLRWLPMWDKLSPQLKIGQEIMKAGMPPDWRAWALLGTLYIAAAGAIGAVIGAGVGAARWLWQTALLQDKLREQQEQLRKGQPELKRLRDITQQIKSAREELHKTTQQIEQAKRSLEESEAAAQAAAQRARDLQNEIEREKSRALEEYREQLEREQRAAQQAAERISRALDDL